MSYELVAGFETHIELATKTKIFCGCTTKFGGAPNSHCCPVCIGLPGTLPKLNREVVRYAIRAGLAVHGEIAEISKMDRKNYCYPDLSKAYQISQLYAPLIIGGYVELSNGRKIRLHHIHIEEDAGRFTTDDVTDHICKKLIFRHPHVFGTAAADTSEEVLVNWEALKRQEKGQQTTADAMDAVARSLPALWRADKLQSKAAKAGFEFADVSGALDKLDEETRELREAVERGTNFSEELGDVLFAAVKAGRFLSVDPEDALNATCEKFIARFRRVEEACAARGAEMSSLPLDELTRLWNEAKHPTE